MVKNDIPDDDNPFEKVKPDPVVIKAEFIKEKKPSVPIIKAKKRPSLLKHKSIHAGSGLLI